MPAINIDLDYFEHRKTKRTVGLLGRGADLLPIKLWRFCGKFHPDDGKLIGYSDQEIESACDWWGEKGKMVEVFVTLVWLEPIENGYQVHDWIEHQGHLKAYRKRAKDAAASRWGRIRDATSIATSNRQAMQNAPPSNASTSRVSLSQDQDGESRGEGVFAVEPPPGFPRTIEEAQKPIQLIFYQRDGQPAKLATPQFLADLWNECVGRGFRDRQGQSVGRWLNFATSSWSKKCQYDERNPTAVNGRPHTITELSKVKEAKMGMAKDIRNKFCSEVSTGVSWSNPDKRTEYKKLQQEIKELDVKIAGAA